MKGKITHKAYMGNRRRYYRWRIRKVIREAMKEAKEFKVIVSCSEFYWDAALYVTNEGIYFQVMEYNAFSVPQKLSSIEEGVEKLVNWILRHTLLDYSERWIITWEKL